MSKRKIILIVIISAALIVTGLFVYEKYDKVMKIKGHSQRLQSAMEAAKVFEPPTLLSGEQTYEIYADPTINPQILEVTVNPQDVEMGENQIITVKIRNDQTDSITEHDQVTAEVTTDTKLAIIPLQLTKAEGEDALITYWSGIWQREDDYNFIYELKIKAKYNKGENSVVLGFK